MPTPRIVLTGFRGVVETMFLQRLVPALAAVDVAPRILLNDYCRIRVDAARLSALTALVTPLHGDGVCRGSRDELFDALLAPDHAPRTAVLLESNGTTDGEELLAMLTLDERREAFTRPTQVAIVAASRWPHRHWNNALEEDQVATASHLWRNGPRARRRVACSTWSRT
jgi:G3E family GTPase